MNGVDFLLGEGVELSSFLHEQYKGIRLYSNMQGKGGPKGISYVRILDSSDLHSGIINKNNLPFINNFFLGS